MPPLPRSLDSARWVANACSELKQKSTPTLALVALVVLAVLAAANGVWLTLVHLDYLFGSGALGQVCEGLSSSGCAVTVGQYGHVMGIPIAVIGFAGGATTAALGVVALLRREREDDPLRTCLLSLTSIAVVVSAVMAVISYGENSWCPFCVVWYGLNIGQWVAAWAARVRATAVVSALRQSSRWLLRAAAFFVLFGLAGFIGYQFRAAQLIEQAGDDLVAAVPAMVRDIMQHPPVPLDLTGVATQRNKPDVPVEVTLVEFGDFQCPFCKTVFVGLEHYLQGTPHSVELAYAHYPLHSACNAAVGDLHPHACDAARASVCAQNQDRFWPYAGFLFGNQQDLSKATLNAAAEQAGLDGQRFAACMTDRRAGERVARDIATGDALGIRSTPTLFVNGYRIDGGLPEEALHQLIDAIVAAK